MCSDTGFTEQGHAILTEAIEKLILEHTDSDREWDGDEAAETIQARFLEWLPDVVLHTAADKIRRDAKDCRLETHRRYFADLIDPFRLCYLDSCDQAPHWVRKRDGENVPHGALRGAEGHED